MGGWSNSKLKVKMLMKEYVTCDRKWYGNVNVWNSTQIEINEDIRQVRKMETEKGGGRVWEDNWCTESLCSVETFRNQAAGPRVSAIAFHLSFQSQEETTAKVIIALFTKAWNLSGSCRSNYETAQDNDSRI